MLFLLQNCPEGAWFPVSMLSLRLASPFLPKAPSHRKSLAVSDARTQGPDQWHSSWVPVLHFGGRGLPVWIRPWTYMPFIRLCCGRHPIY